MSPRGAEYGVVDPDLLVKGVKHLRVVDASVMMELDTETMYNSSPVEKLDYALAHGRTATGLVRMDGKQEADEMVGWQRNTEMKRKREMVGEEEQETHRDVRALSSMGDDYDPWCWVWVLGGAGGAWCLEGWWRIHGDAWCDREQAMQRS
ncbi:hypothetical protein C8J57DRAFT_1254098 [Mycena rebaudengoi]|nr:hypothetical protein C8J57DRAFT_1254098 [Mycena rebaudengoi]